MIAKLEPRDSMDTRVLSLLACPACYGALRQEPEWLVCAKCGHRYPIVDGIPVLTPQSECVRKEPSRSGPGGV